MNGTRGLVIATAAAFIVGCSVGLMGGLLFMRLSAPPPWAFMRDGRHGPPFFEHGGAGERGGRRGGGHAERVLPMMEHELKLSPEQDERIVAQLDRARRDHAAVLESTEAWIDRELTPAQRERWKQMEARFERWRRGREPGGPPPPDRP